MYHPQSYHPQGFHPQNYPQYAPVCRRLRRGRGRYFNLSQIQTPPAPSRWYGPNQAQKARRKQALQVCSPPVFSVWAWLGKFWGKKLDCPSHGLKGTQSHKGVFSVTWVCRSQFFPVFLRKMRTKKIIMGKGKLFKGIDPTTLLGCGGRLSPGTPHPRPLLAAKFPALFPVRKPVARDLSPPFVLLLGSPV